MTRLIVYNIEYCEGMSGKIREYLKFWRILFPPKNHDQKILEALREMKPDILALVEVDIGSFRTKKRDEVEFFMNGLGMKSFAEVVKYPVKGFWGIFHHLPIMRMQANAIIADKRLTDIKHHMLHHGTKRVVIEASINLKRRVTLLLAHLSLGQRTRKRQLQQLAKIVNGIDNPVILMGDFNTFHGEEEITELIDKTHLHHKVELVTVSTFPAFHPKRSLDYVLTSDGITVQKYEVLYFPFSDHLPILVDFKVK